MPEKVHVLHLDLQDVLGDWAELSRVAAEKATAEAAARRRLQTTDSDSSRPICTRH